MPTKGIHNPSLKDLERFLDRTVDQLLYSQNPSNISPYFPAHIHIEPTNACNLRCIHCHHHEGSRHSGLFTRPLGMMALDVYEAIIRELQPEGGAITLNCQGEPTLHKDIIRMITAAKSKGINVSILTNGTRVEGELAESLLASGVNRIVFSFDAVEKDLYENIRVRGDFEKTIANIDSFIERNHRLGHSIFICMSVIIQGKTRAHIDEYKAYFSGKPIDTIFESKLLNLSGGTGVVDDFSLNEKATAPRSEWPICRVPWENIVVNWDGLVTICPLDYNAKYIAGDIKKSSLHEIWNNERFRVFRQAHLTRDYETIEGNGPLCSKCNCLWDEEYDFRNYPHFAKKAIVRHLKQNFL